MSEVVEEAPVEVADDGLTAGVMLREAREAAGLQLASLAMSLKVPVRKLEALEEDRYDLLPDSVFVRALASSVCRTLKIDAQPILQRLPQSTAPRLLDESAGINAPFRAPGDAPRPSFLNQLSRPVVLVVIVVLLAALVLIFLPSARTPPVEIAAAPAAVNAPAPPETPAQASLVSDAQAPANAAPAAPADAQAKAPEAKTPEVKPQATQAAAAPAAAQAPAGSKPAAAPVVAAAKPAAQPVAGAKVAAANTETATAAQTAASAPAAPPLKGLVVFRANAPSWIEVIDAQGKPILRRLLEAGQSARANSGTMPLSVTVGSADTTEVDVRGKRFDLKPVSSGNVAHFEIK